MKKLMTMLITLCFLLSFVTVAWAAEPVAKINDTPYTSLSEAIEAAKTGDTVTVLSDINISNQLAINKEITLDLNGHTITTNFGYGGIALKGNCSLINGTVVHNGAVVAIKAWNVKKIENLTIQVTGQKDAAGNDKEIGGISVQAVPTNYVASIKNVTITGGSYGIETQYVGDSTNPVIGIMDTVTINAKQNGLKLMAPSGIAKNCVIKSEDIGVNMFRKGLGSVDLVLEDCDVEGDTAVYLHDENFVNPEKKNEGSLNLSVDAATTLDSADGKTLIQGEIGTTGESEVDIETADGVCPFPGENGEIIYLAEHTFSETLKYDDNNHWKECACGEKDGQVAHTLKWIVDKEATATDKGSKHEECEVCDYKKDAVEIPATGNSEESGTSAGGSESGTLAPTDSPDAADVTPAVIWVSCVLAACAAMFGLSRRGKIRR